MDLEKDPPLYLRISKTTLANETSSDLESEKTLQELHDYLTQKYKLLGRVIKARKFHHSSFFALNHDYGHQHYLDSLSSK